MVKSPCRNCEKHKQEFPKCFDTCVIIKEVQDNDFNTKSFIHSKNEYIITDPCTINLSQYRKLGRS